MKTVCKALVFLILIAGCNDHAVNDQAQKAGATAAPSFDSITCAATVKSDFILGDSALALPIVTAASDSISEKINHFLTLQNISGYTLEEVKQQKADAEKDCVVQGLTDMGYNVSYNRDCLLSIGFSIGTSWAYPSNYSTWYNFDLSTGDSISATNLLNEQKIDALVAYCNNELGKRIAETKKQYPGDDFILDQLKDKNFTKADLNHFFVTANHVVFVYIFGFPHAIQGAEPDNMIKIPREEFRKYLNKNPYKL